MKKKSREYIFSWKTYLRAVQLHHPVNTWKIQSSADKKKKTWSLHTLSIHFVISPRGKASNTTTSVPDPWHSGVDPDPDPAIFVIDLQDASKKLILHNFSAYYFLKVHLHHFSKIKSQKESQNKGNQGFSYYFCMMIEGAGSGAGSGSIPLTSGSGSGRPRNMWIRLRIRNTDYNK